MTQFDFVPEKLTRRSNPLLRRHYRELGAAAQITTSKIEITEKMWAHLGSPDYFQISFDTKNQAFRLDPNKAALSYKVRRDKTFAGETMNVFRIRKDVKTNPDSQIGHLPLGLYQHVGSGIFKFLRKV